MGAVSVSELQGASDAIARLSPHSRNTYFPHYSWEKEQVMYNDDQTPPYFWRGWPWRLGIKHVHTSDDLYQRI